MKLPFMLASDFSGFLEILFLSYSFWVLLISSVIGLLLSFEPTFKSTARGFTMFSIIALSLQVLALLSYLKTVPGYRWAEELSWNWRLLITAFITILAAVRNHKNKADHAPKSSQN
jgi:hypothetical protein